MSPSTRDGEVVIISHVRRRLRRHGDGRNHAKWTGREAVGRWTVRVTRMACAFWTARPLINALSSGLRYARPRFQAFNSTHMSRRTSSLCTIKWPQENNLCQLESLSRGWFKEGLLWMGKAINTNVEMGTELAIQSLYHERPAAQLVPSTP